MHRVALLPMRPHVLALFFVASGVLAPKLGHADEAWEAARPTIRVEDRGPNRLLLATGIATFGFAYGVSGYIGATSSEESDRFLLVPAVGPFVALAERAGCAPGSTSTRCMNESTYEGLLVASGAMQLAGLAQIAVAFIVRERREIQRPLVMPLALRQGGGVVALATF